MSLPPPPPPPGGPQWSPGVPPTSSGVGPQWSPGVPPTSSPIPAVQSKPRRSSAPLIAAGAVAFGLLSGLIGFGLGRSSKDTVTTSTPVAPSTTFGTTFGTTPLPTSEFEPVPIPIDEQPRPVITLAGTETPCPDPTTKLLVTQFNGPPPMCIDPTRTYVAEVTTSKGKLSITLDAKAAPVTVNNFVVLARYGYFDNTTCHRIIPSFVVQCGDPTASGMGGPGYSFADELPAAGSYQIGSLAMANSGKDTNGSQFFIIVGDDGTALPPSYSLFGQTNPDQDAVLDSLEAAGSRDGRPIEAVLIQSVVIVEA